MTRAVAEEERAPVRARPLAVQAVVRRERRDELTLRVGCSVARRTRRRRGTRRAIRPTRLAQYRRRVVCRHRSRGSLVPTVCNFLFVEIRRTSCFAQACARSSPSCSVRFKAPYNLSSVLLPPSLVAYRTRLRGTPLRTRRIRRIRGLISPLPASFFALSHSRLFRCGTRRPATIRLVSMPTNRFAVRSRIATAFRAQRNRWHTTTDTTRLEIQRRLTRRVAVATHRKIEPLEDAESTPQRFGQHKVKILGYSFD